jgi:hypothetical protein
MSIKKIVNNPIDESFDDDVEWSSVTSFSGLPGEENGVIRYVAYEKNLPIVFGPKSTVKRLDVGILSVQSEDQELLHYLLQKTK